MPSSNEVVARSDGQAGGAEEPAANRLSSSIAQTTWYKVLAGMNWLRQAPLRPSPPCQPPAGSAAPQGPPRKPPKRVASPPPTRAPTPPSAPVASPPSPARPILSARGP